MKTLVFATNNDHKVREVRSLLKGFFEVVSLKEAGIGIDIPEPFDTLEANAIQKARVIHEMTRENCFSEDTGLEVAALGGRPGVKSARYAGEGRSFSDNIDKLLGELLGHTDRNARFRTVICLMLEGRPHLFEGICEGHILKNKRGSEGFGYDPIFVPQGSEQTFAEMSLVEKNQFSHRRKAMDKLIGFLQTSGL